MLEVHGELGLTDPDGQGVCHSWVYESESGELAQSSAIAVAASSSPALADSVPRNARSGPESWPSSARRRTAVCAGVASSADLALTPEMVVTGRDRASGAQPVLEMGANDRVIR